MSRETADNTIGGYESLGVMDTGSWGQHVQALGGGSIGLSGGETTAAVASPELIELQRKADMADELAEALRDAQRAIEDRELIEEVHDIISDALAKYRGQS